MNTETIRQRKSVRTFDTRPLEIQTLQTIEQIIQNVNNPFGIPITLTLLNKEENGLSSPVLTNEKWYVAGKMPAIVHGEEAYGYSFEDFILKAQDLGLGTVWLAATIQRPAFENAIQLQSQERMPAVSPIGYPASKPSTKEKLMRLGMKSDSRKPFETLFFDKNFSTPLFAQQAKEWRVPLEMVRLAPSATNKQPWRLVVDGNKVHFYEKKAKGYANAQGDIQKVDVGIAMRHFDLACLEQGQQGKWIVQDPHLSEDPDLDYIATWVKENER